MAEDEQEQPQGPRPLAAAGLLLAAFLHLGATLLVWGLGLSLAEGGQAVLINHAAGVIVGPLVALFVVLSFYASDERTTVAVGLRGMGSWKRGLAVPLLTLVLGIALVPLLGVLADLIFALWPPGDAPLVIPPGLGAAATSAATAAGQALQGFMGRGTDLLFSPFLLLAMTAGPFCEELLYRGVLRRRLVVRGWRGIVLISMAFAIVQLDPRYIPGEIVLGLCLGLCAWAGRSTWGSIVAHVAHRSLPLVLPLLGLGWFASGASALGLGLAGAAALVALIGLWLLGRSAPDAPS